MTFTAIYPETEKDVGGRYTVVADNWNQALALCVQEYGEEPEVLIPASVP